jgi:cyanophycinase-like exopeptidase
LRQALASTGRAEPRVAYIGAASGDDAGFFRRLARVLEQAGAGAVTLAPTCGHAPRREDLFRRALAESDAVFVSGGDVDAGMQVLGASGVIPLLRERFDAGIPFVGLSAGSIILGTEWIAWEESAGETAVRVFPCLGFAPLICDTHSEDDDWSELRELLTLRPAGTLGYGISSSAMLCVHADGRLDASGGEICCLRRSREGVHTTWLGRRERND